LETTTKNITISNCVFTYCNGLALETVDGGLLEDVSISNITMRDIAGASLFLRLGSRLRGPPGTKVGALRRVNISSVVVYNADPRYAAILSGIPGHPLEDVTLSNIHIWVRGGGTKAQAAIKPPEQEAAYPEPSMFGTMPSYGFFLRHVRGITLTNIGLHTLAEDLRPAFALEDVADADLDRVKAPHAPNVPILALTNVRNLRVHQTDGVPDTQ